MFPARRAVLAAKLCSLLTLPIKPPAQPIPCASLDGYSMVSARGWAMGRFASAAPRRQAGDRGRR